MYAFYSGESSLRTLLFLLFLCFYASAQESYNYSVRTIVFYNVENLFDIKNDSLIFDDQRTPNGKYRWTAERYAKKVGAIARVISKIGFEKTRTSPDIVGLCEVENASVVRGMVQHSLLLDKDYGIVHFDSPDERGIDVALLYKKSAFLPTSFKSHRLVLMDEEGKRDYTRDQLVVGGLLDQEQLYFLINHWPSRSGGESRSKPFRIEAARLHRRILDSIQKMDPTAKFISMGDFNDDPISDSIKKVLKTTKSPRFQDVTTLFNPMENLYRKGFGSLAYRDRWNLFDQFLLSQNLTGEIGEHFMFWKAGIYQPEFLKNGSGKYQGYPFRTYVGTTYQGGYADHFPVYLYLIRKENTLR